MANRILPSLSAGEYSLLAMLFMAEFSRSAFFISFLPIYATEFLGWSLAAAGMAASVHYFTETLVKFLAGWHLDRFGRPVIQGGLLVCLISLAAAGTYSHPAMMAVSAAAFGLGLSPLWIGVITVVAPAKKKDRSSRVSLVFAAWLAGMGSGLSVINFFMSAGYFPAFSVIVGCLLTAFIFSLFFFPPVKTGKAGPDAITRTLQMISNKSLTRLLLPGMFLQTLSASILIPVLPVFAKQKMGLSHDSYGVLLLAGGAATLAALIPMGRLADKINLKPLLFTGLLSSSAALSLLAVAGNSSNALFIVIALGVSYGAVLPAWNTLLAKAIPPERQATGWGLFSTVEGLGISAGPAMGGFLANVSTLGGILLITSGILSIMAFFYVLYPLERFFTRNNSIL
ncbi:MAG: MFS transporter [Firmicutes bacterium]|nr:MFS transporter [Bacillota bacterium]